MDTATAPFVDPALAVLRPEDPTVERVQVDYFGFSETHTVMLPDGASWVQHKKLNEGARAKYLNASSRELTIDRKTQRNSVTLQPGDERRNLLEAALCGWNLQRGGQPLEFNKVNLRAFLENADPAVIELIEKDVKLKNPWLLAELDIESIDREIAGLYELRAVKVKEAEGNV